MTEKPDKINVFISYSHQDEALKEAFEAHLSVLKRQGYIDVWHDGKISPGGKWNDEIKSQLDKADIVLMLISPDLLASQFFNEIELKRAVDLYRRGKITIVPIILRPGAWKANELLAGLQVLPERGEPVVGKHWDSLDEAFTNVVKGLKNVIKARKELIKSREYEKVSRQEIVKSGTARIQVPGGPLRPDVTNYIERPPDNQLNALPTSVTAPMFLIVGSIQSGKSSLIKRFFDKVDKKTCFVISVDLNKFLDSCYNPTIKGVFQFLCSEIQKTIDSKKVENATYSREDVKSLKELSISLLSRVLEKKRKVYLIIDSIDSLHHRLRYPEETDELVGWLEMLRNTQDTSPFNQLTVIAVMTTLSYPSSQWSHLRSLTATITLPNFGRTEIKKLLERMGIKSKNEEKTEKIFHLFGGHPFLSHLAVYELYSGSNIPQIQKDAFNLLGGYGYYWKRVKPMLEYISKRKGYKGQIDIILKALASRNKTQLHYKIINDLFEELYILGLVEMNHEISSEFIKNAIAVELAKDESVSSSKISLEKKTYGGYQSPQFQSIQGFNQLVLGERHQLTSHLMHLLDLSVETCFKNECDTVHRSIRILDTFLSDSFILDRIEEIIKNSKVFDYRVEILLLDPFSILAKSYIDAIAINAIREINQTLFQIRKAISIILKKHDLLRKEFESRKMVPQFLLEQLSEIRKDDEFNLEIKFYDLLTETPIYLISQFIMKGFLLYKRSSTYGPWMILVDDPTQEGDLFDYYSQNFDSIWVEAKEIPCPGKENLNDWS